jgi:hypothetical protein
MLTSFDTMTIGAADLAFRDLGVYGEPVIALREQVRYPIHFTAAYMIEFEYANIRAAAVHTGMF